MEEMWCGIRLVRLRNERNVDRAFGEGVNNDMRSLFENRVLKFVQRYSDAIDSAVINCCIGWDRNHVCDASVSAGISQFGRTTVPLHHTGPGRYGKGLGNQLVNLVSFQRLPMSTGGRRELR